MFYKGSMVFRMLRETIGRETFDRLLQSYLQQYRGKNASIDEFEKMATSLSQGNLRYFFAQWVEGTGVPSSRLIIRSSAHALVFRAARRSRTSNRCACRLNCCCGLKEIISRRRCA